MNHSREIRYSRWAKAQSDSYRATNLMQLGARAANGELSVSPVIPDILAASWRYATKVTVRVETKAYTLKSELHVLERPAANAKAQTLGYT